MLQTKDQCNTGCLLYAEKFKSNDTEGISIAKYAISFKMVFLITLHACEIYIALKVVYILLLGCKV